MKAKLIKENIRDILKPKSKEEIELSKIKRDNEIFLYLDNLFKSLKRKGKYFIYANIEYPYIIMELDLLNGDFIVDYTTVWNIMKQKWNMKDEEISKRISEYLANNTNMKDFTPDDIYKDFLSSKSIESIYENLFKPKSTSDIINDLTKLSKNELNIKIRKSSYLGDIDIIKYLLEAGADINTTETNMTPLMYAAAQGHYDTVKFLLDNGADPYICLGDKCLNAIDYANFNMYPNIAQLINKYIKNK